MEPTNDFTIRTEEEMMKVSNELFNKCDKYIRTCQNTKLDCIESIGKIYMSLLENIIKKVKIFAENNTACEKCSYVINEAKHYIMKFRRVLHDRHSIDPLTHTTTIGGKRRKKYKRKSKRKSKRNKTRRFRK